MAMVKVGLYVRMVAKPGKEDEIESLLAAAQPLVEDEAGTLAWFAFRLAPSTYGIFDVFPDPEGREAHLAGRVAATLMERAPELFLGPPAIEGVEILAAKLPSRLGAPAGGERRDDASAPH
jgi:quinol monooxygenase YgiN